MKKRCGFTALNATGEIEDENLFMKCQVREAQLDVMSKDTVERDPNKALRCLQKEVDWRIYEKRNLHVVFIDEKKVNLKNENHSKILGYY